MRRREFIAGLGGAVAWPLVARAQQGDRVRRIGVLLPALENDPSAPAPLAAFREALKKLGWIEDVNMRLDIRYGGSDASDFHALMEQEPQIAARVNAVVRDRVGREVVTPRVDIVAGEIEAATEEP